MIVDWEDWFSIVNARWSCYVLERGFGLFLNKRGSFDCLSYLLEKYKEKWDLLYQLTWIEELNLD